MNNLRKAKCCGATVPLEDLSKNRNGFCNKCNNKFYLRSVIAYEKYLESKDKAETLNTTAKIDSEFVFVNYQPIAKYRDSDLFIMGKDYHEYMPTWGFSDFFTENFKSIDEFKNFYSNVCDRYQLIDEYDKIYTWEEFEEEWKFHCKVFNL